MNEANNENLSFVMAISSKLKLKKKIVFETLKRFKGLKYRQQIIHKSSSLTIINDSKSTTFSSSTSWLPDTAQLDIRVITVKSYGVNPFCKKKFWFT